MRTAIKTRAAACACATVFAAILSMLMMFGAQPAQAFADEGQLTTAASSSSSSSTITPGVYCIQSELSGRLVLDVTGASKANGANVQLWTSNKTDAQRWKIAKAANGTYTIQNMGSKKYLDVTGASAANYTNIQQYKGNKTAAQRWYIKKSGTGYIITSAVNQKYVLDTSTVSAADGTNVILYKKTGATDQKWWLIPEAASITSKKTVKDGTYELHFAAASDYVVDVEDASYSNGANVQIYTANGTLAQRWYIHRESNGFYSVRSVCSGKALMVAGGNPAARTNIQLGTYKRGNYQLWSIVKHNDGSYTFRNKATGLALDIVGARADDGTNVRTNAYTRGASQRITLERCDGILDDGTYNIYSMLSPSKMVVEIPNAATKKGTQAQINVADDAMAQRYYLRQVSGNVYTIQAAHSGLYLADASGKVVQRKQSNAKTQRWTASLNGSGIVFTNVATGKRMAVSGGKAVAASKLVTAKAKSQNPQRFRLVPTRLVPDGIYEVKNELSGNMLDVTGASMANGANVQVYKKNGTAAQAWEFTYVDDGYYKIENDGSSKVLDVVGASKDAGANVQQYTYNKTGAQLWKPEMRKDGSIAFINKTSSMALSAAGSSSGSNVCQVARIGKKAQGWYLTATTARTISGNTVLDAYIKQVVQQNSGNFKACFAWVTANIDQVDSVTGVTLANGIISKENSIQYALYAFQNKKADGYYFGSVVKWLAIGCGYTAEARAGQVPAATGGLAHHGWAEITSGGTKYVCDADLALELGGGNDKWFMFTYAKAPIQYTL